MPGEDLYTIGEVAAILGVSPHTIRAWERRHGIVHPQRTLARQRRYSREDVGLLREVKRAIDINGLSLKLAFQAVTGGQALDAQVPRRGVKRSEPLRWSSDHEVWRAVADVLTQLVMIIDSNGKLLEANVATAKTFGTLRQRLPGRSFADLVDPYDRAKAVLLYRTRTYTQRTWELNLATQDGPRLYSFQSWPVIRGGDTALALVGSEMFASSSQNWADLSAIPPGDSVATRANQTLAPATDPFHTLVDQLSSGVAVVTIGPEPRIVYANGRFGQTLELPSGALTGRRLRDFLPEAVIGDFGQAVETRSARAMRVVPYTANSAGKTAQRYLNIGFRPLLSSDRRVTSVLVLIEDATVDVTERQELENLVSDDRFQRARNVRQLAQVGLKHLSALVPNVDFTIALANPKKSGRKAVYYARTDGWHLTAGDLRRGPIADAMDRAASLGAEATVGIDEGGESFTVTSFPVQTKGGRSARRKLGVVACRRPAGDPLPPDQRSAIEAFVASLVFATELLHVQEDAARRAARLEAVVSVASAVRDGRRGISLGIPFLERLTRALDADGCAIGRVVGSDFVVDLAYARHGAHAKPGDRFPLAGQYVSESVRSGEPTATTRVGSPGLPETIRKALSPMRHALSVPLVLKGHVFGVITLLRMSTEPFNAEDIELVQSLTSVALLSVNLGRRRRRLSPA